MLCGSPLMTASPTRTLAAPWKFYAVRDWITDCGKEARNNTAQTQSKTISLNRNSPVRFQAIGSVDQLHLTTLGVVKKNDHVIANVITPIKEPTTDRIGLKAPATSNAAMASSAAPRKLASPRRPNTDSQKINGLL